MGSTPICDILLCGTTIKEALLTVCPGVQRAELALAELGELRKLPTATFFVFMQEVLGIHSLVS